MKLKIKASQASIEERIKQLEAVGWTTYAPANRQYIHYLYPTEMDPDGSGFPQERYFKIDLRDGSTSFHYHHDPGKSGQGIRKIDKFTPLFVPESGQRLQYRKIIRIMNGDWSVEQLLEHSAELLDIIN